MTVTCIQQSLRNTGVFARYGGDEFIAPLPQAKTGGIAVFTEHGKELFPLPWIAPTGRSTTAKRTGLTALRSAATNHTSFPISLSFSTHES
jgi:GGDEF domain-containing protein